MNAENTLEAVHGPESHKADQQSAEDKDERGFPPAPKDEEWREGEGERLETGGNGQEDSPGNFSSSFQPKKGGDHKGGHADCELVVLDGKMDRRPDPQVMPG